MPIKYFSILSIVLFCYLNLRSQGDILIKSANVIHAESGIIQRDVSIHISNGSIKSMGQNLSLKAIDEPQIIDAKGKYLMHGLIDAHVHFFQSGGIYTRPDVIDLRSRVPYSKEQKWLDENLEDLLKRYTAAGITHLCDVGGPMKNYQIRDLAAQWNHAPQLFVTGPLISTYQPDAFKIEDPPIIKIHNPEEAKELVRKQISFNPSFIKIWYIVGAGQTAEANLPIIKATIQESHKHGVKVAVHATQLETARMAVKAGADILVHSVDDKEVDEPFVKLLVDREVTYIPTLIVSNNYNRAFSNQYPFSEEDFRLANPVTLGTLMDLKHIPDEVLPVYIRRLRKLPYIERKSRTIMASNLKKLWDAGVNIVTGTDAGNIGTLHASSYLAELRAMHESGLSNAEVLKAATVNGGKMLGNSSQGIIAEGKPANLILLIQNPLDNLQALSKPELVITRGKLFYSDSLISHSPESLAQRQLNAYNARNIEEFIACYHPQVKVFAYPDKLLYEGREIMRNQYSSMFANTPDLHCELVNRIVMGNVVMDQEKVTGFGEGRILEAAAIYTVEEGLITEVRFVQ